MIVVLGFCTRDQDLTLRNAQWWNELGGCKGHELLVCIDPRCDPGVVEATRVEMDKAFDKLWRVTDVGQVDDWPQGANYFFKLCCTWLQNKPQYPYFFWTEPDAIPLAPGWLDTLEAEYKRAGKPFMGDRVEVQVDGKDVPLHMSGVAFYQNPIYLLAGEAYRAHDEAWDMAARKQIVPHAHFTDLIEHAWKHPTFKDQFELNTQIAKEAVIFHSSKDGSLITLLQQRGGNNSEPERQTPASSSGLLAIPKEPESNPGSPSPFTYDIFIRTYPGDYEWLDYCLNSIRNFVTGFRKVWIVSPDDPPSWLFSENPNVEWKKMNDETPDGYLAQQITKLYADVITDYQPDYILHVDSDVIFKRPTTPADFFWHGKMLWYYTPYSAIQTPWQPIVEKFMKVQINNEFMRRLPMMVPRWLYPKLRENCHRNHGVIISDYIRQQGMREFSEFNAMGAFAYIHHREKFEWWHTTQRPMPEPFAKQFHSWSGLTPQVKCEIDNILTGGNVRNVPVAKATETTDAPPQSPIKVLPSGLWVLEGDQISQWVEQEGRLDHDQNLLPELLLHVKAGATVVDVGAFIGDHTIAYARAVGPRGIVYAFEPNPVAYQCLEHNLGSLKNVHCYQHGFSNKKEIVPLSGNNGNAGGAYVGEHMKIGDVPMDTLDHSIPYGADFIKIDVEGYELKVLEGAEKIINQCHPAMAIEINREALRRQGATPDQIFGWLTQHCYGWRIIEENALRNDPLYNIIALPAVVPERIDVSASTLIPPPQASLTADGVKAYIKKLKDFAGENARHKAIVSQHLVHAKLRAPNKKTRRKRQRAAKKHKAKRAMGLPGNQAATQAEA